MNKTLFWFLLICCGAVMGAFGAIGADQKGVAPLNERLNQLTDSQVWKVYERGLQDGRREVFDYLGPMRCIPGTL